MKILKENKGLVLFYIFMALVMVFWVCKVDKENDKMLKVKNTYILNSVNN